MPQTDRQPYVDLYINNTRITTSDYLTAFEVKKDIVGYEGTFELFDPTWTNLEAIALERGVGTEIKFTYGWMGEQSNLIVGRLDTYTPEFSNEGLRLTIDWALGSRMAARIKRSISWSRKKKVSDIVREIAVMNGWQHDIEPTKGIFSQPLVQSNVSDLYFIKNVLAPRAMNRIGVGGFKAIFEENKLIFKSLQTKDTNIYKTYNVYRQMDGEVISFAPTDNVTDVAQLGGRRVKIRSFDPISKKVIEAETSYQDITTSVERDGRKVSSVELDADAGKDLRVIQKSFHTKQEIRDYAKIKYAEFSQNNYYAEASLLGDPFIPIGGNLEFSIITPEGQLHYLSGVYKVSEITDTIGNGEFTSAVTMSRRASIKGSETIEGIKQNLVKVSSPPGSIYKEASNEQG